MPNAAYSNRYQTYKNQKIMKTLMNLILLILVTTTAFAQVQSNCDRSWGLNEYYERDITDLALTRLFEIQSPDTNQIVIPEIYKDTIWSGLSAIYNAVSISQRDSIFDIYCIHNSPDYASPKYPAIYIIMDTTYDWTSNWQNGNITTGYDELDLFINSYNYYIQTSNINSDIVILNTEMALNPNAVSDSIENFNGIILAIPDNVTFNGNKIEYSKIQNFQFFDFTLAWGDCLSGCINKHKWKFKVNYLDCTVEYLGLESYVIAEFPNPTNCNITSIENNNINSKNIVLIYPNPTSDFLTIESESIIQVELWNDYSPILRNKYKKQDFIKLDIKALKPGIYFIKIKTEKELIIRKVIKI